MIRTVAEMEARKSGGFPRVGHPAAIGTETERETETEKEKEIENETDLSEIDCADESWKENDSGMMQGDRLWALLKGTLCKTHCIFSKGICFRLCHLEV
mmetsp:Transcript_5213/g.8980  ORF Transcript_5213/g.8980 Transcript_5213/m.8980 type:complete len:99 (-) Transcript_5213:822-1118(-)